MKRCRTCHPPTMKPLSEFSLDAYRPDGHRSQCKECANKNTARYLSDHPDYVQTNYENNKEEMAKKYREQHPLMPKKTDDPNYQHNYYLANSERIKAQAEKWRAENPGRVLELNSARESGRGPSGSRSGGGIRRRGRATPLCLGRGDSISHDL